MSKLTIGDLSIDCANPLRAQNFYANFMDWEKLTAYGSPAVKTETGMLLLFTTPDVPYVPPIWPEEPGREQKQMHLDFDVEDVPAAVEKAVRLGATKAAVQFGGEYYVTMLDTEGHPFCLCKKQESSPFIRYYEDMGYGTIPSPSINMDCPAFPGIREFYAKLSGWDTGFHETALVADNKMVVHFMACDGDFAYVPPVWPEEAGKQQKQMHFNFQVDDLQAAVEEALALGATKAKEQFGGEHFVTLLDPVGHLFCLCRK
jgi:predicted enzyme related to lactoylglutathione lyase